MTPTEEIITRWRVPRADGGGDRLFDSLSEAEAFTAYQTFVQWMLDRNARYERLDDALNDDDIWKEWSFERKETAR